MEGGSKTEISLQDLRIISDVHFRTLVSPLHCYSGDKK